MSDSLTRIRGQQHCTIESSLQKSIFQNWRNHEHTTSISIPPMKNFPNDMDIDLIYHPHLYYDTILPNAIIESILSDSLKNFTFNTDENIPNQKHLNISTFSKKSFLENEKYCYDFDSEKYTSTICTSSSKCFTNGSSHKITSIITQPSHMINFYGKQERQCYIPLSLKDLEKSFTPFHSNATIHSTHYSIKNKSFIFSTFDKDKNPIYATSEHSILPIPTQSLQPSPWKEKLNHMKSIKFHQPLKHLYKIDRKFKTSPSQTHDDSNIETIQNKTSFTYKKTKINTCRFKDHTKKRLKKRIILKHLDSNRHHLESDIDGYNADLEDVWCSN